MIQIYSSELFLREKGKNCVNSDQYTEYFEDIYGSKIGSLEIPGIYNTSLIKCACISNLTYLQIDFDLTVMVNILFSSFAD